MVPTPPFFKTLKYKTFQASIGVKNILGASLQPRRSIGSRCLVGLNFKIFMDD